MNTQKINFLCQLVDTGRCLSMNIKPTNTIKGMANITPANVVKIVNIVLL